MLEMLLIWICKKQWNITYIYKDDDSSESKLGTVILVILIDFDLSL